MDLKAKIEIRKLIREKKEIRIEINNCKSKFRKLISIINTRDKAIIRLNAKIDVLSDNLSDARSARSIANSKKHDFKIEVKRLWRLISTMRAKAMRNETKELSLFTIEYVFKSLKKLGITKAEVHEDMSNHLCIIEISSKDYENKGDRIKNWFYKNAPARIGLDLAISECLS